MPNVSYDRRAITIDGKRTLLLSGAIHYPRSTPGMWRSLMEHSKEAGLNAIETYVFWNLHERRRGVYDFSDRLDIRRFLDIAHELGLYVILRIGPYICAETNYGGLPAWLRDVPGIQMRTDNEPFLREMERWVRLLCDYVRPYFAPNGGPIILAQIENEYGNIAWRYGEAGEHYLKRIAEMAESLQVGVPWVMCKGSAPGTIETINAFYAHPLLDEHFTCHPDKPALWTEHWPGWYDLWGYPHNRRTPENVAYAAARFFAAGGTGMNYYMWHGGTNFDRDGSFLQTTSYDYDAPLDEFGLPTTKMYHLAHLHRILQEYAPVLVESERAQPETLPEGALMYTYQHEGRSLLFLCNDDTQKTIEVSCAGRRYQLPPQSVTLIGDGQPLMNTAQVEPQYVLERRMEVCDPKLAPFQWWVEPLPNGEPIPLHPPVLSDKPVEQLQFTHDETDYCWYVAKIMVLPHQEGKGVLELQGVADVVHLFLDGQFVATTQSPLPENRNLDDPESFTQRFELEMSAGEHTLAILCCALGLVKGDWMLGEHNMADERKGFWGRLLWRSEPLEAPWRIEAGLRGEHCRVYAEGSAYVRWESSIEVARGKPLCWWKTTFERPKTNAPLALDLSGMTKGMAWLNGRCIGRYWLAAGTGKPEEWLLQAVYPEGEGLPTQRYYHLPADWLREQNVLVLFEELGGDPTQVRLCMRV
ncbi:MAG: hypothetical protein KatS3mg023_2697 [Armatimonadota bacterium]|nr:MAG: hypothetical protein KatS3mg023_2697 [Armatimonadota bacterium]